MSKHIKTDAELREILNHNFGVFYDFAKKLKSFFSLGKFIGICAFFLAVGSALPWVNYGLTDLIIRASLHIEDISAIAHLPDIFISDVAKMCGFLLSYWALQIYMCSKIMERSHNDFARAKLSLNICFEIANIFINSAIMLAVIPLTIACGLIGSTFVWVELSEIDQETQVVLFKYLTRTIWPCFSLLLVATGLRFVKKSRLKVEDLENSTLKITEIIRNPVKGKRYAKLLIAAGILIFSFVIYRELKGLYDILIFIFRVVVEAPKA